MSLEEARRQLERAQKTHRGGDASTAFKAATTVWNETRLHRGDPAWKALQDEVFRELSSIEKDMQSLQPSTSSSSTPLILK